MGGWGGRWQKLLKKLSRRSWSVKTWTSEQSIGSCEAQCTLLLSWVQSQVDAMHLMHSTGAIMSVPYLHNIESCPQKSRPSKYAWRLDTHNCTLQ